MVYVSKEVIQQVRTDLKALNKKFGVKTTVTGLHAMTLRVTIVEGVIDFGSNMQDCVLNEWHSKPGKEERAAYLQECKGITFNHYHAERQFSGTALDYIQQLIEIIKKQYWDESDLMTDYFHCSFYIDIQIGRWDKPYMLKV